MQLAGNVMADLLQVVNQVSNQSKMQSSDVMMEI